MTSFIWIVLATPQNCTFSLVAWITTLSCGQVTYISLNCWQINWVWTTKLLLNGQMKCKRHLTKYICLRLPMLFQLIPALPCEIRWRRIYYRRCKKMCRSEKWTLVLSVRAMLSLGPSQVSLILGVNWGDTDADTRKCVGWHPLKKFGFCTEFYVLWPSVCRPLSNFAHVDSSQLLCPSAFWIE